MEKILEKARQVISTIAKDSADYHKRLAEITQMLANVNRTAFINRSKASKATGLSYLAGTNSSAKIVKGLKKNYDTMVMYLAASDMSGFNICPMATDGCKLACLVSSGRARMLKKGEKINSINWARLKKTWLFYANREFFMAWLDAEIESAKNKAIKKETNFAVRLNGTSDIAIDSFMLDGKSLLDIHSDVQFYDYTKVPKQLDKSNEYSNYDVTFSFANSNQYANILNSLDALENGHKLAVCFDKKSFGGEFPKTFLGYEVTNGDETDLTFLQEKQILALDIKKTAANPIGNAFIVTEEMAFVLNHALGK